MIIIKEKISKINLIKFKPFFLLIMMIFILKKKNKIEILFNNPILPNKKNENNVKVYHISKYDLNHIRYNFQEIYEKRKIFKIDYSFFLYKKINKKISYIKNAEKIYNSTGMLNMAKLNFYYNNKKFKSLKKNHIHLTMAFDRNYTELSSISIASILNVSNKDTFIHFHILCLDFKFKIWKK